MIITAVTAGFAIGTEVGNYLALSTSAVVQLVTLIFPRRFRRRNCSEGAFNQGLNEDVLLPRVDVVAVILKEPFHVSMSGKGFREGLVKMIVFALCSAFARYRKLDIDSSDATPLEHCAIQNPSDLSKCEAEILEVGVIRRIARSFEFPRFA